MLKELKKSYIKNLLKEEDIYSHYSIQDVYSELKLNEAFIKKLPLKQWSTNLQEIDYLLMDFEDYDRNYSYLREFDFDKEIVEVKETYQDNDTYEEPIREEKEYKLTFKEHFKSFYIDIKVWLNYRKAMSRNKPDSVLWCYNFLAWITNPICYYFEFKGNYVFGVVNKGLFTPSHFAPTNLTGGVALIKEIKNYDNVVFAVTDDLSKQLIKIGFKTIPFSTHKTIFRDQEVKKTLLGSNIFKNAIVYLASSIKKK